MNERYLPEIGQQDNLSELQKLMNTRGNPGAMGNSEMQMDQFSSRAPAVANAENTSNQNANPNMRQMGASAMPPLSTPDLMSKRGNFIPKNVMVNRPLVGGVNASI